jgi:hypothetical protein
MRAPAETHLPTFNDTKLALGLVADICAHECWQPLDQAKSMVRLLEGFWRGEIFNSDAPTHRLRVLTAIFNRSSRGDTNFAFRGPDHPPMPAIPGIPPINVGEGAKTEIPMPSQNPEEWTIENCSPTFTRLADLCHTMVEVPWYMSDGAVRSFLTKHSIDRDAFMVWVERNGWDMPESWGGPGESENVPVAQSAPPRRPMTALQAARFVQEYSAREAAAGRRTTQSGAVTAAANEGFVGGREFIRTEYDRLHPGTVNRGRPRNNSR